MKKKIYQVIAGKVSARLNCIATGNTEWEDKHTSAIYQLALNYLPQGSGFDNGVNIDLEKSTGEKLYLTTSYHFMNEHGYYDGWEDYKIIVTPSLQHDYYIRIVGKNRDDIKDYIDQLFSLALDELVLQSYS